MKTGAALCLVLLTATGAAGQSLPKLTQPVNDLAHVIDQATAFELDRRIRALERATLKHDTVVVATVPSIAPYGSVEEYAVKLFESAGIGQKGQNNGLLVVLSTGDRQVRIEVGYDLEEYVTDGYAGDVIRQDMLPPFRSGNYSAGLLDGTTRLINRIAERRGVKLTDVPASAQVQDSPSRNRFPFGLIVFIIFMVLAARRRRGRRSGFWGQGGPWFGGPFIGGGFGGGGFGGGGFSGGGGGGFGGFGGGMSGGGGASGRF